MEKTLIFEHLICPNKDKYVLKDGNSIENDFLIFIIVYLVLP